MSFFSKLGRVLGIIRDATGVILPISKVGGEVSPVTLSTYRDAYLKDPAVSAAVDYLAEQAVGVGFFVTSSTPRAKELADEFNAEAGMDQLLMQVAKECVYGGNSFLEKVRDENKRLVGLKLLPLTSMRKIKRERVSGRVLWYEQRIGGETIPLEAQNVVHFKYNAQDGEAFGSPVIRSLVESYEVDDRYTRQPFLKIKAKMEAIMPKIFERYAAPKRVWIFKDITDEKAKERKREIEQTRPDEDLVFNPPTMEEFDIKNLEIDPRARFDGFVNYIESQYISGMQTPVVKLYTAPGFTEASANVAKEVSELKIGFIRRFLKRVLEREIYKDLVQSNGMNPLRSPVALNWGVERPEITFESVVELAKVSTETGVQYLTREEVRRMLRKFGFELEEEPNQEQPAPQEKSE